VKRTPSQQLVLELVKLHATNTKVGASVNLERMDTVDDLQLDAPCCKRTCTNVASFPKAKDDNAAVMSVVVQLSVQAIRKENTEQRSRLSLSAHSLRNEHANPASARRLTQHFATHDV
jgi:hypothetical protein